MAFASPPENDLIVQPNRPYLLSKQILIDETPDNLPGFVYDVKNGSVYKTIYYRKEKSTEKSKLNILHKFIVLINSLIINCRRDNSGQRTERS